MTPRAILASVFLALLALPAWAQSDLRPQQAFGCPLIYSNSGRVHTRYADLREVYDDLHTIATASGRLCGFEIHLRNSSQTEPVVAEVTFYSNTSTDTPPTDPITSAYRVTIPANHDGPISVDTPYGEVEPNMWVGVRFLNVPVDGQGFVGLVEGPAETGNSHNLLYSLELGDYIEFGGLNADIYVVLYSDAPRSVEDSTWGRVKGAYR
jgi:hypothetical protein